MVRSMGPLWHFEVVFGYCMDIQYSHGQRNSCIRVQGARGAFQSLQSLRRCAQRKLSMTVGTRTSCPNPSPPRSGSMRRAASLRATNRRTFPTTSRSIRIGAANTAAFSACQGKRRYLWRMDALGRWSVFGRGTKSSVPCGGVGIGNTRGLAYWPNGVSSSRLGASRLRMAPCSWQAEITGSLPNGAGSS